MILRKINMPHMLENHWVRVIQGNMIGQHKHNMVQLNLVCHLLVLRVQRIWFIQWVEHGQMKIEQFKKCIRRLMETFNQVNRRIEIMNGNLIQMLIYSGMVKRELKMEQQWLYMPNAMKINSLKLLSSKRQLKTTKQFHKIFSVNLKI